MTVADRIYEQVKGLPDPLAQEVLDFARFLVERGGWRDLMDAQGTALTRVWDNAEDSVWDDA